MRLGTFALKQWAIFGRDCALVGAHRPQGKKLIMTAVDGCMPQLPRPRRPARGVPCLPCGGCGRRTWTLALETTIMNRLSFLVIPLCVLRADVNTHAPCDNSRTRPSNTSPLTDTSMYRSTLSGTAHCDRL
jgi:hypothetical protein